MAREFFKNLPSTETPLTAPRINGLLDGDETMGNIVVDSIKSKNMFNINGEVNVRGNDGVIVSKNTVSGNILTTNVNGSNENYVGQKLTNLNGKIFTFSAKIISLGTGTAVRFGIYDNNTLAKQTVSTEIGNYIKLTYTATSDNIVVSFGTSNGAGAQFTDIQVEYGDTRTDYTPYQNLKGTPEQTTFNNEWLYALYVPSFGWNILVPIVNPSKKIPTLNITTADYYSGSWTSINLSTANIRIDTYNETMALITISTSAITTSQSSPALVRLKGYLSINY